MHGVPIKPGYADLPANNDAMAAHVIGHVEALMDGLGQPGNVFLASALLEEQEPFVIGAADRIELATIGQRLTNLLQQDVAIVGAEHLTDLFKPPGLTSEYQPFLACVCRYVGAHALDLIAEAIEVEKLGQWIVVGCVGQSDLLKVGVGDVVEEQGDHPVLFLLLLAIRCNQGRRDRVFEIAGASVAHDGQGVEGIRGGLLLSCF